MVTDVYDQDHCGSKGLFCDKAFRISTTVTTLHPFIVGCLRGIEDILELSEVTIRHLFDPFELDLGTVRRIFPPPLRKAH